MHTNETTLFVIPLVVVVGWGMGVDETTLGFNGFDVAALLAEAIYIFCVFDEGWEEWLVSGPLVEWLW
jgi:Ca2+:H+ antiporter